MEQCRVGQPRRLGFGGGGREGAEGEEGEGLMGCSSTATIGGPFIGTRVAAARRNISGEPAHVLATGSGGELSRRRPRYSESAGELSTRRLDAAATCAQCAVDSLGKTN